MDLCSWEIKFVHLFFFNTILSTVHNFSFEFRVFDANCLHCVRNFLLFVCSDRIISSFIISCVPCVQFW